MFYKYLIPLSSAMFMLGCSGVVENQNQPELSQEVVHVKPGTIRIKTTTGNTEVELEFNVGTDNIVFVMDVSDEVSVIKDGKELVNDEGELDDTLITQEGEFDEELASSIDDLDIAELAGLDEKNTDNAQDVNEITSNIVNSQALFYDKEYYKSLAVINKVLKASPNNAVANAIKGSIYYQLGDKKQANIYWKTALKLDPSLDSVKNGIKSLGLEER